MSLRRRPPCLETAEMLLRCLTLVFLATMATSAGRPVILDKQTKSVTFPFGSALRFKCDLNTSGYKRFTLNWFFTPSQYSDAAPILLSRNLTYRNTSSTDDPQDNVLDHTMNATEENSGWYFCNVTAELPDHLTSTTNRTKVTITRIGEHTTCLSVVTDGKVPQSSLPFSFKDFWQWVLVGASASVLIVFLLLCVLLRRRCCKKKDEQPVYANTKATHKQTQKPVSCSHDLLEKKLSKRHNEGKRRYEQERGRPPL